MGLFSGLGYVFNFRVDKWIGWDNIKASSKNVYRMGQAVFTPEQAEYEETFEEACERLNITAEQLQQRKIEFTRLLLIYLALAALIFGYSIFIVYAYRNIMGFIMGFCVTIFTLVHAFRYHFWLYQITHKKLGCTIKEWFFDRD